MQANAHAVAPLLLGAALALGGCDMEKSGAGVPNLAGEGGEPLGEQTGEETGQGGETGEAEAGETGEEGPEEASGCNEPSPYEGGWDIGCCQDDLVPTPWAAGEITPGMTIPDWTFTDQFGEAVRVYDFCHEAIYFEYVAAWCTSCQAHATEIANLYATYGARGLMTLTFISESGTGGQASLADAVSWSSTFGQDGLVVFSDAYDDVWYPFALDTNGAYSIAIPGTMLLESGMKIAKLGVPTLLDIELVLP